MASAGARKMGDVDAEHLADLNAGRTEARTLTEALVIDHTALLSAVIPDAPDELTRTVSEAQALGILKRMAAIGAALREHLPADVLAALAEHPSDTVRGW